MLVSESRAGVAVCVREGKYHTDCVKAMRAAVPMILNALTAVETRGEFWVRPGGRSRLRTGPGIRLKRYTPRTINLVVRPEGTETTWEYIIAVPNGVLAEELFDRLLTRNAMAESPVSVPSVTQDTLQQLLPQSRPEKSDPVKTADILQGIHDLEAAIVRSDFMRQGIVSLSAEIAIIHSEIAAARCRLTEKESELLSLQLQDEEDMAAAEARTTLAALARLFNRQA